MCCSEVYFVRHGRKKSEALRAVRPSRPQPSDMSRLGESCLNKEPTGPQNKTFGHRGPIARRASPAIQCRRSVRFCKCRHLWPGRKSPVGSRARPHGIGEKLANANAGAKCARARRMRRGRLRCGTAWHHVSRSGLRLTPLASLPCDSQPRLSADSSCERRRRASSAARPSSPSRNARRNAALARCGCSSARYKRPS